VSCPDYSVLTTLTTNDHSDNQIKDQIEVLNKDYASVGVSWNHVNTTWILSQEWFENLAPER